MATDALPKQFQADSSDGRADRSPVGNESEHMTGVLEHKNVPSPHEAALARLETESIAGGRRR